MTTPEKVPNPRQEPTMPAQMKRVADLGTAESMDLSINRQSNLKHPAIALAEKLNKLAPSHLFSHIQTHSAQLLDAALGPAEATLRNAIVKEEGKFDKIAAAHTSSKTKAEARAAIADFYEKKVKDNPLFREMVENYKSFKDSLEQGKDLMRQYNAERTESIGKIEALLGSMVDTHLSRFGQRIDVKVTPIYSPNNIGNLGKVERDYRAHIANSLIIAAFDGNSGGATAKLIENYYAANIASRAPRTNVQVAEELGNAVMYHIVRQARADEITEALSVFFPKQHANLMGVVADVIDERLAAKPSPTLSTGATVNINSDPITIGRSASCDVRVETGHGSVSRIHATITPILPSREPGKPMRAPLFMTYSIKNYSPNTTTVGLTILNPGEDCTAKSGTYVHLGPSFKFKLP